MKKTISLWKASNRFIYSRNQSIFKNTCVTIGIFKKNVDRCYPFMFTKSVFNLYEVEVKYK